MDLSESELTLREWQPRRKRHEPNGKDIIILNSRYSQVEIVHWNQMRKGKNERKKAAAIKRSSHDNGKRSW